MATSSPRLLTLPREIRAQVYRFLFQGTRTRWRWNHWPLSGNAGIATIILDNAPYANVLLSCSRLREEYLESDHFRLLHVIIALSLDEDARYTTEDVWDQRFNDRILPRLKSVTVVLEKKGKLYDHLWLNVFVLRKALAARSAHLELIKVVARERGELPHRTSQPAYFASNTAVSQPFFPCPYDRLAELPLHKHDELQHKVSHDDDGSDLPNPTNASDLEGRSVTRTGTWIFARAKRFGWHAGAEGTRAQSLTPK